MLCPGDGRRTKTLDESSLVRIAAQYGIGPGYVMQSDVREDLAAGRLLCVLGDWTTPLAQLALYYTGRKNPPAAFTAFIHIAREFVNGSTAAQS